MAIEIVYDRTSARRNKYWLFPALNKRIRGEFDLHHVSPKAMEHANTLPVVIPGQVIGVEPSSKLGYVIEPIHRNEEVKRKLLKFRSSYEFEPERTDHPEINVNEWLYWMKAVVDLGHARLVEGEFPKDIDYTPPVNPFEPVLKTGEARKREIFRNDPASHIAYLGLDAKKREQFDREQGILV